MGNPYHYKRSNILSDERKTNMSINQEEKDREAWFTIILFILYAQRKDELLDVWDKFEEEILYNNRFFIENEILKEIATKADEHAIIIPKDKVLYRARIYNGNATTKFIEKYKEVLKSKGQTIEEIKQRTMTDLTISMLPFMDDNEDGDSQLKYLRDALKKYNSDKFKGYNAEESLPPKKGGVAGRANPEGISYIYACEDEDTPIYEVRPSIGQTVSLAKLKLKKDVKLFNLTIFNEHKEGELINLFDIICEKFSVPNYNETNKYIPTQYIAEYIKKLDLNFDGIYFDSSLNTGGKNVVLFDRDICSVMSTKLVEVKGVKIEKQEPAICQQVKKS